MISRRRLFVVATGLLFTNGCKRGAAGPASCDDVTSLGADDRSARTTLGYSDRSTDPSKACSSCQQWVPPPAEGSCGGCKLLKGPIHPNGTCKAFARKG